MDITFAILSDVHSPQRGIHMVADHNAVNTEDNVNTRDQNKAGIWLIVVVVIFVAFLTALGLGHAPQANMTTASGTGATEMTNGTPATAEQTTEFSVSNPVGELELPGTVGKPQNYVLNGHGNTPATYEGETPGQGQTLGVSPGSVENPQSFKKAPGAAPPGK